MKTTVTMDDIMDRIMADAGRKSEAPFSPSADQIADAARQFGAAGYLPYDRASYAALAVWFATHTAKRQRRGLVLTGQAGAGKTLFLRSVLRPRRAMTASEIVSAYRETGGMDAEFWHRVAGVYDGDVHEAGMVAIDDLGQEPLCIQYGERVEVLDQVLCAVHRAWERAGTLLVVTTNMDPGRLDARYGRRVTDRLGEMAVCVEVSGPSRRTRRTQ